MFLQCVNARQFVAMVTGNCAITMINFMLTKRFIYIDCCFHFCFCCCYAGTSAICAIIPVPADKWEKWSSWWNENWQGKLKYLDNTCPSSTVSTTNPRWTDLELNSGHRGDPWRLTPIICNMEGKGVVKCMSAAVRAVHMKILVCDTM
jgi:hypothetical protein